MQGGTIKTDCIISEKIERLARSVFDLDSNNLFISLNYSRMDYLREKIRGFRLKQSLPELLRKAKKARRKSYWTQEDLDYQEAH